MSPTDDQVSPAPAPQPDTTNPNPAPLPKPLTFVQLMAQDIRPKLEQVVAAGAHLEAAATAGFGLIEGRVDALEAANEPKELAADAGAWDKTKHYTGKGVKVGVKVGQVTGSVLGLVYGYRSLRSWRAGKAEAKATAALAGGMSAATEFAPL